MKNLFGDDEPARVTPGVPGISRIESKLYPRVETRVNALGKAIEPPAEYTLEDRFKELDDAIEVVAVYAIEHRKERGKVIDRAVKLIERLKKLK